MPVLYELEIISAPSIQSMLSQEFDDDEMPNVIWVEPSAKAEVAEALAGGDALAQSQQVGSAQQQFCGCYGVID